MKWKALVFLLLLVGCTADNQTPSSPHVKKEGGHHAFGQVDSIRLMNADREPGQWLTSGRDFKLQHYSPLHQINVDNITRLGFAWEYPVTYRGRVQHTLEATPQVVDGVIYTSGPWGTVYAVDAQTGKELWRHDPDVDGNWARRACCGVVNRGVAIWKGRIYVGTLDGFLLALNAETGSLEWKVDTFVDREKNYSITSAPSIADDKVVIGNSGADYGVRGYISAFDAETGEFSWRFYTVPDKSSLDKEGEAPEIKTAAKTWSADTDWESGGGGTVWGHMTYDPELNLLYVGVGNASPWPGWHRSPGGGDNLYLSSILAINPDSGKLEWHYQTTPAENWDYTATQHIMLAELTIAKKQRKVLMQAPKNGFFYVLDRKSGELLSANNYAPVNWASHIDLNTGRPVLTGAADYQHAPKVVMPGPGGAHNWQPMSYNPASGLVYIPVNEGASLYVNQADYRHNPKSWNLGADFHYGPPFPKPYEDFAIGYENRSFGPKLKAWNPTTQQEVWSKPGGGGGTLTTAGNLVIQGTYQGQLIVYHAVTGEKLKTIDIGTNIVAAPMSFSLNGEQYVAVMAGTGSPSHSPGEKALNYQSVSRLLAFRLGGGETPRPPVVTKVPVPEPPPIKGTPVQWEAGKALYDIYCVVCHRATGTASSSHPNLMIMSKPVHQLFNDIVLKGIFSTGGMASFADTLNENEVESIHQYLIAEQHKIIKTLSAENPDKAVK